MRLLDRWRGRHRPLPVIDPPGYRTTPPAPPPPAPGVVPVVPTHALPVAPVGAALPGAPAATAMRLMLADGTIQELEDPELKARAEYLIKSMLPPAPPPPPGSS